LVTNEPDQARAFIKAHAPVLTKPLWCSPWQNTGGVWCAPAVAEVSCEEIEDSISATMHLFQQVVIKSADIRTTVIGEQVFSVQILSDLLDWRDDYDTVRYRVVDTPTSVRGQIQRYMDTFGLSYGAFDFAQSRTGEWVFLECNPSGQFAWMEPHTGLPMVSTLADLLQKGAP
jgi:hypothetical protein